MPQSDIKGGLEVNRNEHLVQSEIVNVSPVLEKSDVLIISIISLLPHNGQLGILVSDFRFRLP